MNIKSVFAKSCLMTLCLTIGGCGYVPARSELAKTNYDAVIEQDIASIHLWAEEGSTSNTDLTTLIQSPILDRLVTRALVHNPDLQRSWLNLQRYRQELVRAQSTQRPQVNAGFDASREEDNGTSYNGDITIGWQMDLWGKLANTVQAAEYDVTEQALLYQQVQDTLVAEVSRSWLALISQQHEINIEQERLATLEKNAQFIEQRYRNGLGSLEDRDEASSAVASSKASLVALQQDYRNQQRQLQILLGDLSFAEIDIAADYPDVALSALDLPEYVLARRPDLQAAYQAIKAAQSRTDVAYQDLLPDLDLTASLSQLSDTPQAWLLGSPAWALLGELTAPIFNGGELRASISQAELDTAMSYQTYRETLLAAAKEVDDAIDAETSLRERQQYIETALAHKLNTLTLYQQYYREGLVSILDLLAVQQASYDLRSQNNILIYQQLMNRIDLGLAMGLGVNK